MTTLADGPAVPSVDGPAASPAAVAATPGAPSRASGVELLGEQSGSGYRDAPSLVRRADGQMLQLTPLLYLLLDEIDGRRDSAAIAAAVSERFGRGVDANGVDTLIDQKLRPLGLVQRADGTEPEVRKANPLLALRFRYVVSDPERTRRVTRPFALLFHPIFVVLGTLAFAAVGFWVLFLKGLASAAHDAFASPGLLLAVFALTVVSAGFHEFGHAAALRRGGGTPGAMGAGLYLIWPAFYTDVTDSYRLGRGARLRTDLGGLYFNALVSLAMFGVWTAVRWDGLLLVIATQILQMVRQLPPMLRFDGYHILADLTGVPDLFHRIKPTLVSMWPTKWRSPEARVLKPWVRAVVTLWVLLVVPLMLLTALVTILTLPRILATSAHSIAVQASLLGNRWDHSDWLGVGAKALALLAVTIPVVGITYMLSRTVRQLVTSTWKKTEGKPAKRALAGVIAALLVAGLAYAWWPRGNYRPIQSYERGVLQQAVQQAPLALAGANTVTGGVLHEGRESSARTVLPAGKLPTAHHPQLSIVLSPRNNPNAPTWVFPFNRPAPPGVGDNQSMAIATKNGSTVYDVAFALVWADHPTVLNKNEAYAFASCTGCTAAAVSFQVVLIVGNANVVAPQNISAAVSYNCLRCVTEAMAIQLDLTLAQHPNASTSAALDALWKKINAFGQHLQGLSFNEIQAQLTAYEQQIVALVRNDFPKTTGTATPTPGTSVSGSTAPSGAPASGPAASTAPGSNAPASQVPASDAPAGSSSTPPSSAASSSDSASTSAPASAPASAPSAAGTAGP